MFPINFIWSHIPHYGLMDQTSAYIAKLSRASSIRENFLLEFLFDLKNLKLLKMKNGHFYAPLLTRLIKSAKQSFFDLSMIKF